MVHTKETLELLKKYFNELDLDIKGGFSDRTYKEVDDAIRLEIKRLKG